jgi:hypothetical protein
MIWIHAASMNASVTTEALREIAVAEVVDLQPCRDFTHGMLVRPAVHENELPIPSADANLRVAVLAGLV